MADTKVENETEIFSLDGFEYFYLVDDPGGTPTPGKVASRNSGAAFMISSKAWGVAWADGFVNASAAQIPPNMATTVGSGGGGNSFATTNERTRRKRIPQTTGASAGSGAGLRGNDNVICTRGGASGRGGFRALFRFAINTMPASWRAFVGLAATTSALTNADPSSVVNMVGIGKDAADTAWQIMSNDGSGTATKAAALNTTNFPINDTAAVFEFEIYCPPGNAQNVTYWVRKISGVDANGSDTYSTVVTGTLSSDLPAVDTGLTWHLWVNNDVNAAAAIIDMMRVYYEAGVS